MAMLSVTDKEFEELSKNRANFEDRVVKWLGMNEGAHSTQKVVVAIGCSYGNCYAVLKRLQENGTIEAAYSGRVKVWRLKKVVE